MDAAEYPNLDRLVAAVLGRWPAHGRFVRGSFAGFDPTELELVDDLARRIAILAGGDLDQVIDSYRWTCAEIAKETLYFRKYGRYRLSSFAEAESEVYSNGPFMKRYMEGLLLSQVLWRNHSGAFNAFRRSFLASADPGFGYLEIGPGHGLFLSVAAELPACGHAEAWDVSAESLRQTHAALAKFGVSDKVALEQHDVMRPSRAPQDGRLYDRIAVSEVLEHIEQPREALVSLRRFLAPEGRIFINVPLNSPAPDHIYLLRDGDEARELVESAGLAVLDLQLLPMTGYTLSEAQGLNATISCLMVAR